MQSSAQNTWWESTRKKKSQGSAQRPQEIRLSSFELLRLNAKVRSRDLREKPAKRWVAMATTGRIHPPVKGGEGQERPRTPRPFVRPPRARPPDPPLPLPPPGGLVPPGWSYALASGIMVRQVPGAMNSMNFLSWTKKIEENKRNSVKLLQNLVQYNRSVTVLQCCKE